MPAPSPRARAGLAATSIVVAIVAAHVAVTSLQATQTPGPAGGDRIVVGQLLDAVTNRPVGHALVTLTSGASAIVGPGRATAPPASTITQRTFADDSGRFLFHSLPAGSYALAATLNGYAPAQFGQTRFSGAPGRLELQTGSRVTNITMKIWKLGSITGTIRDEAGEPIGGVRLQVIAVTGPPTRRQYTVRSFPNTDDRGIYRSGELPPGDYLVQVPLLVNAIPVETAVAYLDAMTARSGNRVRDDITASGGTLTTAGLQIGDQLIQPAGTRGVPSPLIVNATGRILVYPQTYHPAAATIAQAAIVTLPPGEQRAGIDIALRPVPAFRITGLVTNADGPVANTTVKILPEGPDGQIGTPSIGGEIAMAVTRRDGTFMALGIPAGRYIASIVKTATPPSIDGPAPTDLRLWWSHAPIVVGDADVTGVQLQLTPGVTVAGRVEFDTTAAPSAAILQRMRVGVRSSLAVGGDRPTSAPVSADGTFTSGEIRPGRYLISVQPAAPGLVLRAMHVGGRDVTGEPVDVTASGIRDVVVTFTDKASELTGTVAKGATAGEIAVYAVPVDPRVATQVRPALLRRVVAASDGSYRFTALVPGEYVVAALLADASEIDPEDPRAIAALLRSGARVILGDREKRSQNLSLVSIK